MCQKAYKIVKKTNYFQFVKFQIRKIVVEILKPSLDWISREGRNALKFRFLKSGHITSVYLFVVIYFF